MNNDRKSIFERPVWVALLALTAATAWGWAYPLIKLGFEEFAITGSMTAEKMLFAGVRFAIAGMIVLGIARTANISFALKERGGFWYVLLFALMNTTLHYAFFYIGLSHSGGARAAILNSLGVFLLVLFACMFFKSDKLTTRKIIGCVIGFAGILALNVGSGSSSDFTLMGDGMIILNALCSAIAGLMTRGLGKRVNVFVGTGYSLALGGVLLIVPAVYMGARIPQVTFAGVVILLTLVGISTFGFMIYNKLLTCNPVG
ncbi:MAG: DMT family transporter, partial [Bacteroidaceae bacterium]|nr:DMT family transporter [Bacteroidaceae bacterium]